MPFWGNTFMQDSSSPMMEHLNFLHDHNMMMISMITAIVISMLTLALSNKFFNRFFLENQEIEYFWTSMPAFLLLLLAFPSMKILYMTEEYFSPSMTSKISGHQWYWSYEYPELKEMAFDSFIQDNKMIRLLDTSNHLIIPALTTIRMLITSEDVIHSWTIPSMGIKVDAIPGRMNQLILFADRTGLFTGQCSEICGSNHSFMPITLSAISIKSFINSLLTLNTS